MDCLSDINTMADVVPKAFPTPTHGIDLGSFTVAIGFRMSTDLSTVVTALLDTRLYSVWNHVCPHATIHVQPNFSPGLPAEVISYLGAAATAGTTLRRDTVFVLEVHLDCACAPRVSRVPLRVSCIEESDDNGRPGVVIAFDKAPVHPEAGQHPSLASRLVPRFEMVHHLVLLPDIAGGRPLVQCRCWVTFYGARARALLAVAKGALKDGLTSWKRGLVEHCEAEYTRRVESLADPVL